MNLYKMSALYICIVLKNGIKGFSNIHIRPPGQMNKVSFSYQQVAAIFNASDMEGTAVSSVVYSVEVE